MPVTAGPATTESSRMSIRWSRTSPKERPKNGSAWCSSSKTWILTASCAPRSSLLCQTNSRQTRADTAWQTMMTAINASSPPPWSITPRLIARMSVLVSTSTPITSSMRSPAWNRVWDTDETAKKGSDAPTSSREMRVVSP